MTFYTPIDLSDKQAYEQKLTAQLLLWTAKLERLERKARLRQKQTDMQALMRTRQKIEEAWHALQDLKAADTEEQEEVKDLWKTLETLVLGVRRAMC